MGESARNVSLSTEATERRNIIFYPRDQISDDIGGAGYELAPRKALISPTPQSARHIRDARPAYRPP